MRQKKETKNDYRNTITKIRGMYTQQELLHSSYSELLGRESSSRATYETTSQSIYIKTQWMYIEAKALHNG